MTPLVRYFAFTYALTWSCWWAAMRLARAAAGDDRAGGFVATALFLLGTIAPSLVAVGLTARAHGESGVRRLLRPILHARVPVRWYVFALGYLIAIKLAAAVAHRAISGEWPRFGTTPWAVMLGAILVSMWVQAGEEVGWRGFALPRLAARFGLGRASVGLGILWACWHLPLFFVPGADTYGQSFPLYLLQVTALSVAIAWLHWRTGGSLLLCMLMHAAVNNTRDIVPSAVEGARNPFAASASLVAWLTVTLLWVGAAFFLVRMRNARFTAAG